MKRIKTMVMTCGLLVASMVSPLQAAEWDKQTLFTLAQALQVGNTLLNPGQYVLKLADANSERDVVQIFSGDGERLKAIVLAIPAYRLEPTGTSEFTVSEAVAGQPATLRFWFYPGDNFGLEFPVSKQSEGRTAKAAGKSQTVGQEGGATASGR